MPGTLHVSVTPGPRRRRPARSPASAGAPGATPRPGSAGTRVGLAVLGLLGLLGPLGPLGPPPASAGAAAAPAGSSQPAAPIRAAFFYPWFPSAWTQQGISCRARELDPPQAARW
jgi:hypothetical protein